MRFFWKLAEMAQANGIQVRRGGGKETGTLAYAQLFIVDPIGSISVEEMEEEE